MDNRTDRAAPWWATPTGFAVIAMLLTLPRLLAAGKMGLLSDEAYYAFWSMHLSPGYFDHSPGIAYAVWAGRAVLGEGPLPVRLTTLVAGIVTLGLLYRLGTLLFADRRIGALAGYFYAVSVGVALSFSIATPDGISTLFWVAVLWAVAEFAARGNPNWWLAAGALAGLGLLSKYTNVFVAPGLALYIIVNTERRRWLGLWQLWAGALLAGAMFLPVVWWNAEHGWMSFTFQLGRSSLNGHGGISSLIPFTLYWLALAGIMLPPAFLLLLVAMPRLLRRGLDLPLLTSLPVVLFFGFHSLVNTANPNWLDPVFPPLMLGAAWAAVTVRPARGFGRWVMAALRWSQLPLGIVLLLSVAVAIFAGTLPFGDTRGIVSYGRGWDGLAADISDIAKERHAQWVDTESYLLGSLVGYAMLTNGDPLPVLQTNQPYRYTYSPPPDPALLAAPHLLVRVTRNNYVPPVENATPLSVITRRDGDYVLGEYAVYLIGAPS